MLLTERIRLLADSLNMTFASLERDAGIGRGTIRKWDSNCPSADKLLKVANLLNTSIDYLMTGATSAGNISQDDLQWLELIHQLPPEKMYEFKGELKGYLRRMEEDSVAAEHLRTGTDNLGK